MSQSSTIRALLAFASSPPKGPFAKLFTKRSGRNKKKSLLRLLRSDFWFKGFSRPFLVAILELCAGSRLFRVSSGVFTRVGLSRMLGVCPLGQYRWPPGWLSPQGWPAGPVD